MKHHAEKFHPTLNDSLRSSEKPAREAGDAISIKRDMSEEQKAAFQPPEAKDPRVVKSEGDQGRTR